MPADIRLSKLMSQRGLCSRREADRYIERGWVKVNGEVVNELGVKVAESAEVELTADAQKSQQALVTIMFSKPVGVVSAQAED
ncbi:MAG: S4 domain-containing protein, partial [Pseudomonadota bacterium]